MSPASSGEEEGFQFITNYLKKNLWVYNRFKKGGITS